MYLFVVYLTMPSVILVTPRKITRRLCNVNWKRYKNHSLIWVSRNIDKFSWIDWGKPRRTLVRIFDVPAEIRKKNTSWKQKQHKLSKVAQPVQSVRRASASFMDSNVAERASWGVGLWPLACRDCGFEFRRGHGCSSRCVCCVLCR